MRSLDASTRPDQIDGAVVQLVTVSLLYPPYPYLN